MVAVGFTVNGLVVPTVPTPSDHEMAEIAGAVFPVKMNRGRIEPVLLVFVPMQPKPEETAGYKQAAEVLSALMLKDEVNATAGSVVTVVLVPPVLLFVQQIEMTTFDAPSQINGVEKVKVFAPATNVLVAVLYTWVRPDTIAVLVTAAF